jgi:hypothetical protein
MAYGYGLGAITTVDGLIPALPEPNGMLVRATPPGDADDVATDDKALLLKGVPQVLDLAVPLGSDVLVPTPIPAGREDLCPGSKRRVPRTTGPPS